MFERLKDIFYFRRRQVYGSLSLLLVVGALVAANFYVLRRSSEPAADTADSLWQAEYETFERHCLTIDSTRRSRYARHDYNQGGTKRHDDAFFQNNITVPVHDFDPNTADSLTLIKIGFSPYVTRNIMRYRAKGGVYRSAEQFGRTYGLDSAAFAAVKTHLMFAADTASAKTVYISMKRDTVVELNYCDTADLVKLRSIGSYRARSIVAYRKRLGGFYDYAQLAEISIPADVIDSLRRYSTLDKGKIRKINLNKASVGALKAHPYISFDQAKAIYELRRMKIALDSPEQIRRLDCISDSDYERLRHYLTAE